MSNFFLNKRKFSLIHSPSLLLLGIFDLFYAQNLGPNAPEFLDVRSKDPRQAAVFEVADVCTQDRKCSTAHKLRKSSINSEMFGNVHITSGTFGESSEMLRT